MEKKQHMHTETHTHNVRARHRRKCHWMSFCSWFVAMWVLFVWKRVYARSLAKYIWQLMFESLIYFIIIHRMINLNFVIFYTCHYTTTQTLCVIFAFCSRIQNRVWIYSLKPLIELTENYTWLESVWPFFPNCSL